VFVSFPQMKKSTPGCTGIFHPANRIRSGLLNHQPCRRILPSGNFFRHPNPAIPQGLPGSFTS
jgi:hypothetical protein